MIVLRNRFEKYIMPEPNTGCWIWTGAHVSHYRGRIKVNGKDLLASRVSFMLYKGDIPIGFNVCHTCDNMFCVNPDHLFLGTQKDNVQDMIKKGRRANQKGSLHPSVKITDEQVNEIRTLAASGTPQKDLIDKFNISQAHVSRIVSRTRWNHV